MQPINNMRNNIKIFTSIKPHIVNAKNSKMVFMPLKGNFDAKKIEDKISKELSQGEYTQVQNTYVKQENRQTLHREKSSENEKVTQTENKPFTKEDVKMTI